jgi:2,3-dihydroxybiphenyl 1,2-dioxygenase
MYDQVELAYLGIQVPEPSSLDAFFGDVIGLMPGAPVGSTRTWRDDAKRQRLFVESGATNDASFVGFEATDDAAFDAVAELIRSAGHDLAEGTAEERAARGVERLSSTTAPWGVRIELVTGLAEASAPFESPLVPGGFHTAGVGFGHCVFATTRFDESHEFATGALGLQQSDWLEMELAPGIVLEVRFYHCNERHHTLALARAPFEVPQALHHVMFETNDRDDVGAAFDRAWAADLPIPNGLGRHDNDGMFSFYVQSPAGFQVEVGHGARVVPADWDDNHRYDRISLWGHQPLHRA